MNGSIHAGDHVKFFNTGMEYDADEIGVLKMDMIPRKELRTGDVGYIISGIKNSKEVKVGDTITQVANPCSAAIEGFQEVKPMVFAGVYPIDPTDYENLRASLEKLQLNDASLAVASWACSTWRSYRSVSIVSLIWMSLPPYQTYPICVTPNRVR